MENLENYVTFRKCLTEESPILVIDLDRDNKPMVYEKKINITQTDKSIMKKLIVEKILDMTKNQIYEVLNTYNINTYIKLRSSTIAAEGKIGNATNILISEENFNKYNLKDVCNELELEILFDNSVKDIILYRRNEIDMPGLVLCHTEDKYELIEIGLFPEKQFYKINL
jgi:hypothetical protein